MHHDGIPIAEDDDGNVLYRMPMPPHWNCTGSGSDDYWDGYCDCEVYYNDIYYCGTSTYSY